MIQVRNIFVSGLIFLVMLLSFQNCSESFESSYTLSQSSTLDLNDGANNVHPLIPPNNNQNDDSSENSTDLGDNNQESETNPESPPESLTKNFSLRIFPGAEGFGTQSPGGRGGQICFVDNLKSSGEGSLRSCVEKEGRRIVIFRVGGVITVSNPIRITSPFISIYGQTATGDGILIRATPESKGNAFEIQTHDVLLQHIRVRAGTSTVNGTACCRNSMTLGSTKSEVYNVVIDHSSFSWGSDQILGTWYKNRDITFSYNIFSEGLHDNGSNSEGPAGRGFIVGSNGSHSISLHHNFFAHSYQRNPLLKTSGIVDVTNNLIYHWVSRGGGQDSSYNGQKVNWVKNKYIAITNRTDSKQNTAVHWGDISLVKKANSLKNSAYFEDNIGYHRPNNDMEQWKIAYTNYKEPYVPSLGYHVNQRFEAPSITEIPVNELEEKLPVEVGATLPKRDPVDKRLVYELKTKTGIMPNCVGPNDRPGENRCKNSHVGGFPTMSNGVPVKDSDNDGMPDSWEIEFQLDPSKKDSLQDRDGDGFLNIEEWIYSLNK